MLRLLSPARFAGKHNAGPQIVLICQRRLISGTTSEIAVLRSVEDVRKYRAGVVSKPHKLGFVPTMGALHNGHLSLAQHAAKECEDVIVSIYVNPTQFGVNEDLDSYPKTFNSDMEKLKELNSTLKSSQDYRGRITAIFAPTTKTIYPTLPPTSEIAGEGSFVTITPLGSLLEGASRPVFFRGVATVCMKLFNIVQPTRVYFGQKDVQQTVLIKRLVQDFHLNLEVRIIPTEREDDGLAMSSRNVYLGTRRRRAAVCLYNMLSVAAEQYADHGKLLRNEILGPAMSLLESSLELQRNAPPNERALFELDYISLADPSTMEEVETINPSVGAILSGAMRMLPVEDTQPGEDLGENRDNEQRIVRLIDNVTLNPREG